MSDYERIQSFIDGAKTGIDWLNHKGRLASSTPSEYEEGFRHALDAISGYFDEIADAKLER
jgi:hypothetical protein